MTFAELTKDVKIIKTNIEPSREFLFATDEVDKCDDKHPFICLHGEKFDGNDFIPTARSRGSAIITENLPENYVGDFALVDNARAADAIMASNSLGNPEGRLKIIGVTGTNGKTSVCRILHSILEYAGKKVGLSGTLGNYIAGREYPSTMTTPKTRELYSMMKDAADGGDEYFIVEVSSHSLAYEKFANVTFLLSIFTNLSPEHLDFHKDMAEYSSVKARLFKKSLISLINADDEYSSKMLSSASLLSYRYSVSGDGCDFGCINKKDREDKGIEYYLISESLGLKIESPLIGSTAYPNTLSAASAAYLIGISPEDIRNALQRFRGISGRLEKAEYPENIDGPLIYIDFAHTPEALKILLTSVRAFSKGRKITLVFGCGGDRDRKKRPMMGRIAARLADSVIVTSDNPRGEDPQSIIDDIIMPVKNAENVITIVDRKEAIEYAVLSAQKKDILIFAGKGHEKYQIDKNGKHDFSERDIIKNSLKIRNKGEQGKDREK